MRKILLLIIFALAVLPAHGADAQTVAIHQAANPASTTATPSKAMASAIIPGSPLAALTGSVPAGVAPASAATADDTPTPFGTNDLGFPLVTALSREAADTVSDFTQAIGRSMRLAPVWSWLQGFSSNPALRNRAREMATGLALALVPGFLLEAGLKHVLTSFRDSLAARAEKPRVRLGETEPGGLDVAGAADPEGGETEKRPRRRVSVIAWFRRMGLGLLHLVLSLIPLIGFALVVGVMLNTGLLTSRYARLAVIGVANAFVACRLALEIGRFVLSPKARPLRLVSCPDARADRIMGWLRVIFGTIAAAFALLSLAEILDLSAVGSQVLIHFGALVFHLELAVAIWLSRHVVAGWISGKRDPASYLAGFRHRLGNIWHYLALFYILSLWIAWAAGIQNAFSLLLRVVLVFVGVMVLGALAWGGSAHFLERVFPDTTTGTRRHPAVYARVRAYNPAVRILIRVIIGIGMLAITSIGWGLHIVPWLLKDPLSRALISALIAIVITVVIALTIWEVANGLLDSRIERLTSSGQARAASRLRTLLPMLKATIGVVISLLAGLICLSKIGVNAAPLLAGAGVVGIAVGFGSQKLVQDIITGLFLLLEDAMQVGDVISLASMTGTVERLSIRTIRLRGGDGSINIIPFSAVTTVTNMTRDFGYAQISIQVAYEEDLSHVYDVLREIAQTMRAEAAWGAMMRDDLQIFGLDQFGASALVITGQIRTGPGQHWAVRREFYARVKDRFEQEHIDMPYTYLPPAPPRPAAPAQLSSPDQPAPAALPDNGATA